MDKGYTYGNARGERLALYVHPRFEVPPTVEVREANGEVVRFTRISDNKSLDCGMVPGVPSVCSNFECHRRVLGQCQCGRHEAVRLEKAGAR